MHQRWNPWYWLLLVPCVGLLWVPFFNRVEFSCHALAHLCAKPFSEFFSLVADFGGNGLFLNCGVNCIEIPPRQ